MAEPRRRQPFCFHTSLFRTCSGPAGLPALPRTVLAATTMALLLLPSSSASGRPAGTPKVVLFLSPSSPLPVAPLAKAVRAQLRDLPVTVESRRALDPVRRAGRARQEPAVLLTAWLDPDGALRLWDRRAETPLRRSLPQGSNSVRISGAALILRSAVMALLDRISWGPRHRRPGTGGRAHSHPRTNRKPKRHGAGSGHRPGRPWVGLGLAYALDVFSGDHPVRHELALGLSFRPLAFLGLRLGLTAALPQTASDQDVRLETWSLLPVLGISAFWPVGRFHLGGRVSVLADVTFKKVAAQSQATSTDESTDLQWWAQVTTLLSLRVDRHLALDLEIGARAALAAKRYGTAISERKTLLAPWPVQPVFALGLSVWL